MLNSVIISPTGSTVFHTTVGLPDLDLLKFLKGYFQSKNLGTEAKSLHLAALVRVDGAYSILRSLCEFHEQVV